MNYLTIADLKNAWIFKHKSLPISESDKSKIKPMTEARAKVLWDTLISKTKDHPDFFDKNDWPQQAKTWVNQGHWEDIWDSEQAELPNEILQHLNWQDNTTVYYCSNRKNVIETTWSVFKRCWKNFLFMDDGVILVGKKRTETVQFLPTGYFKIGNKNT